MEEELQVETFIICHQMPEGRTKNGVSFTHRWVGHKVMELWLGSVEERGQSVWSWTSLRL